MDADGRDHERQRRTGLDERYVPELDFQIIHQHRTDDFSFLATRENRTALFIEIYAAR